MNVHICVHTHTQRLWLVPLAGDFGFMFLGLSMQYTSSHKTDGGT